MSLTNLDQNRAIATKFEVCLSSICKHTSLLLQVHIITDETSQDVVNKLIAVLNQNLCRDKINVVYHSVTQVAKALQPYMKVLQVSMVLL